jgi:hypothetical protein
MALGVDYLPRAPGGGGKVAASRATTTTWAPGRGPELSNGQLSLVGEGRH